MERKAAVLTFEYALVCEPIGFGGCFGGGDHGRGAVDAVDPRADFRHLYIEDAVWGTT
jgi:hypothetical protein